MSTPDPNKTKKRTTILLPDVGQSAKRVSNNALLRLFRHLSGPVSTSSARPSEAQHQLVVTGFILGVFSILTFLFPICGLPTAICGLLIGIHARRQSQAFNTMSFWTIGLSLAGLALALLYIIVRITMSFHQTA
jgi:hypothetical protein